MLTRLRPTDDGLALVLVLGTTAVLTLLVVLSLEVAVRGMQRARQDERRLDAMPAAQAGVEDYLHRLNVKNDYFTKQNSDENNDAFTGWVTIPGMPDNAAFRYEVTSSLETMESTGTIGLRASGRVGNDVRTVDVVIRRRGYLDYLYFTDKETTDPARYAELGLMSGLSTQEIAARCDKHYYSGRDAQCRDIQFASEDRLNGPLGSNDAILMHGTPTFTDTVTTGWTDPKNESNGNYFRADNYVSTKPTFHKGMPQPGVVLELPPGNSDIRQEADLAPGGQGCLYTGPTRIRLISSGQMEVTSPYTKKTNDGCGTDLSKWQIDGKDIKQAKKDTVDLPRNGVIYVQPIPIDAKDPNYDAAGAAGGPACPTGSLLDGKFPDDKEWFAKPYSCRSGDAWVEGQLRGRLTIAAANDVYVTGDLTYNSGTGHEDNVLGLIANNNVLVHHPVEYRNGAWNDLHPPSRKITIEAAILALNHSFTVQNYQLGTTKGDLTVNGAIAQRFRGAVRLSANPPTGYAKDYHYDKRLRYFQPPFFLPPVLTSWSVRSFSEQRPAHKP